jgi:hypothetical protein
MIQTPTVRSKADALSALFKRTLEDRSLPDFLAGPLGHYFCVAVAGFLETAHGDIFSSYVNNKAHPRVAQYASSMLRSVNNPKATKFIQSAQRFDDAWARKLEAFVEEDSGRRRGAIDSIMSNRHLIAHGKNSNISIRQVRHYFESSLEVLTFIERDIFP